MAVMQVDRNLRHSRSGMVGIQIVVEANDCRLPILFQNRGALNLSVETPHIAGRQIRMERNQGWFGMDRILLLRQELVPALMVSAGRFPCRSIGGLCRCRVEVGRLQRRWNWKYLHKWM